MNEDSIYKKQLGVMIDKIDGKFYILNNCIVFEVNEVAARIIDLCNGNTSISEISKKLASHFHCEYERIYTDVIGFVEILENNELIAKCS